MARGDMIVFNEFPKDLGNKTHDLDGDTFSCRLITSLPTAATVTPNIADFTECSTGGGYTSGGITLATPTWSTSGAVSTFDSPTNPSWTKAASSPTNIKAAIVVNNASGAAICAVDLTTDGGTTAVSMVDNDISITWNASGIVQFTRS